MSLSPPNKESSIAKDTVIIFSLTLASNLIALFRESIFASMFGAGVVADAYVLAFSVCSSIFLLVSSGNISFAFIPKIQSLSSGKSQNYYYSSVLLFTFAVSLLISFCILLYPSYIIAFIAPGLSAAELHATTRVLSSISFVILFSTLGAVFQASLNSRLVFGYPAAIPFISNLLFVLTLIFLDLPPIDLVIVACNISFIVWLLLFIPSTRLFKLDSSVFLQFEKTEEYVSGFVLTILPLIGISIFEQLVLIIQKYSLSFSVPGSIAIINYAYRLQSIPVGFIAASLSTAIFPRFSLFWSKRRNSRLSFVFNLGLEAILLISIPVIAILFFNSGSIVQLLFLRGSFTLEDSSRVSIAFIIYVFGILPQILSLYFIRLLLAIQKYRVLFLSSFISFIVFVLLIFYFSSLFGEFGIPLASSVGFVLYSCILGWFILRFVRSPLRYFLKLSFLLCLFASPGFVLGHLLMATYPSLIKILLSSFLVCTFYFILIVRFRPFAYTRGKALSFVASLSKLISLTR